jgi:hypothetical protein
MQQVMTSQRYKQGRCPTTSVTASR